MLAAKWTVEMCGCQVEVFWVVTPCSVVVRYQCFRGTCNLHLQGEVARMAENIIDIGLDWKWAAGSTKCKGRDPATSATSMSGES
jgi:hypothetical protein